MKSIFMLVVTFLLIKTFFPELSTSVEHILELALHALEHILGQLPG